MPEPPSSRPHDGPVRGCRGPSPNGCSTGDAANSSQSFQAERPRSSSWPSPNLTGGEETAPNPASHSSSLARHGSRVDAPSPLLRESALVQPGKLACIQAAAFRQPGTGGPHLARGLVQHGLKARHACVDELVDFPPQRGCLVFRLSPYPNSLLLGHADYFAVLREVGGVVSCLRQDPACLLFAFGNLGCRQADDLLCIGDFIRQMLDHVIDRG